jgi:S1-C subfamily serine protease
MFGLNWIDLIIVLSLAISVWAGLKIGFLTQFFTIPAFFVTLFLAGWLFPHLLPVHNPGLKTIINVSLVLSLATYAAFKAFDLGQNIHWSFRLGKLRKNQNFKKAEKYLGIIPAVAASLVLVWLLGVAIGRLPFEGLSNSVNDSWAVQHLTRALPPVPSVFATFDRQIDPNDQPAVSAGPKPTANFNYSEADFQAAKSKASESVVRITSFGCGGVVGGSGFVASPGVVMTNAHVIAGVKRPIIKYGGNSYEGTPILFDAGLDLAILKVRGLKAPVLPLSKNKVSIGSTVAVLGFPGGNYQAAAGIIRDDLLVDSQNVYGTGTFARQTYGIQAQTAKGGSGGPVVVQDGSAVGMIFSKSTASDDYAYALTASYLVDSLNQARNSTQRVGTGACTQD